MKNIAYVLFLLLIVNVSCAEDFSFNFADDDTNKPDQRLYVSLEGSVTYDTLKAVYRQSLRRTEHAHAGAYAIKESIFDDVPMYGKIGISLSLLSNPRYLSTNLEVSSGIRLPGRLSFFWGVGGLYSEIIECIYCTNNSDKNGYVGVFPEFGSNFAINKKVRLGVFMRNYFLSDGFDDFFVYGGSISFLND